MVFIPIMLATGPVAGFFAGNFLHKKFSLGHWVIFFAITVGFLSGFYETIKIIKLVTKVEKEE